MQPYFTIYIYSRPARRAARAFVRLTRGAPASACQRARMMWPRAFETDQNARAGLLLLLLCPSISPAPFDDQAPVAQPIDRTTVAKKHIDWYCQECPIDFLDASTPGARPDLVDGIIPCCGSVDHGHHKDTSVEINCTTGTLVRPTDQHNLTRYAPFVAAGRSVNMDLNGYAACCRNTTDCTILENKETLAAQLLEIALKYKLSGFSMDWEFAESFHWAGFNETMSYVAEVLRPHGLGLGLSINSDCNAASAAPSGMDPSCDPDFRDTPWASMLSDMGTYSIGDLNATWAKNGTQGTCPATCIKEHRHKNDWVCNNKHDPAVMPYCGYEGRVLNMLHSPVANVHTDRYPLYAPAMWIGRCYPNGTTQRGWTHEKFKAHLEFLDTVGINRIGIWYAKTVLLSTLYTKNDHFNKTGSGQTLGKLKNRGVFSGARTPAQSRTFQIRLIAATTSWALPALVSTLAALTSTKSWRRGRLGRLRRHRRSRVSAVNRTRADRCVPARTNENIADRARAYARVCARARVFF